MNYYTDNPVATLRRRAGSLSVEDIAGVVLDDERFPVWSGSSKETKHHYGDGGLAIHTLEVFELASQANSRLGYPVRNTTLFLACLFHDCGKMWDYERVEVIVNREGKKEFKWQSALHKRRIHHISRSAIVWSKAVDRFPAYRDIEDDILHAILAHHGQREYGSPVQPDTKLAWLLHLNDGISARLDDVGKFYRES